MSYIRRALLKYSFNTNCKLLKHTGLRLVLFSINARSSVDKMLDYYIEKMFFSILPKKIIGCAAIINKDNEILTLLKKLPKNLRYELPGGKVEPKESIENAIRREVREEIGCEITLENYIKIYKIREGMRPKTVYVYEAKLDGIPFIKEQHFFKDMKWLPINGYYTYCTLNTSPIVKLYCEDLLPF